MNRKPKARWMMNAIELTLDQIGINPEQPRKHFGKEELDGLAESIRENGIIQPVVVYKNGDGGYYLIDGERRWLAAKLAGLKQIPAVVQEKPDRPGLLAMVANLQRADLTPIEEARAYQVLHEGGMAITEIAHRMGISQATVKSRLNLLALEPEIQTLVEKGAMPTDRRAVDALLSIESPKHRVKLAQKLARPGLKIKTVETACRKFQEALEAQPARNLPMVDFAVQRAGKADLPKWDMLHQAGQVPPWPIVEQAARRTCDNCLLRDMASAATCKDCPGVVLLMKLIQAVSDGR